MIRLLTDGGYPSLYNHVGELFPIDKRGHLYYVTVKGREYVFFPDEVEVLLVYDDSKQLATLIAVTAMAIAIIIYVIF